jgi:hypothetical protein
MLTKFKDFSIQEAEGSGTKIKKIRVQISEVFDQIKDSKKSKKEGDKNSEIASLNKQADLYSKIPALMRSLATEIKKDMFNKESDKEKTSELY